MQFIVSGQRIAVENFVTGKLYTILFKTDTQVNLTCTSIGADCVVFQGEAPFNLFTLTMRNADTIDTIEPTQLGTNNYNNLINKPQINGVDLIGNKTSAALGIREVPAIIEADDGKVLTAASDGTCSWEVIPEGTTDYTDLTNKPQIAGVTLSGNISLADLGAAAASDIPTTPADIGAEPAITSDNKLDPSLIDYDSTHAAITEAQVTQIGTNQNNISSYHKASGTSVFYGETEPTDSGISAGSYWISSSGIKIFGTGATKVGEPPISFISNGDSLSDYTIIGASGGVGNQTENIFNKNVTWYRNNFNDSTNHTDSSTTRIKSDIQDISDSNSYLSLKIFAPITNMRILGIGFFGDDVTTPLQASAGTVTNTTVIQPIPTGAKHYFILLGDDTGNITNDTKTALVSAQICAIYGNTLPSDYIPYGYVIPVTCGGTTTSIYIDNQLGASDSVTFSTTQVTIPTSSGSNILTVETTVQPASVFITYTGWK